MARRRPLLAALLAGGAAAGGAPGPLVPGRVHLPASPAAWAEALAALRRDGAVVLSGLEPDLGGGLRAAAGRLPSQLFGGPAAGAPALLSPDAPVNGVHEELLEAKKRGLYLPGSGLLPHTDGYVYGDALPDFVFLVCEQPASKGGSNVLLDGQALLDALEGGAPQERQLAAWLRESPVDLSEPSDSGITAGRPAAGPVVQSHSAASGVSRLKWRRQIDVREAQRTSNWRPLTADANDTSVAGADGGPGRRYLSLWRPLPSEDEPAAAEVRSRLRELDALLQESTEAAFANFTFTLGKGEALVVDNYRVLHGRAPYNPGDASVEEPERRFWRVWAWTSDGSGLPPDGARTSHPLNDEVFGDRGAEL